MQTGKRSAPKKHSSVVLESEVVEMEQRLAQ